MQKNHWGMAAITYRGATKVFHEPDYMIYYFWADTDRFFVLSIVFKIQSCSSLIQFREPLHIQVKAERIGQHGSWKTRWDFGPSSQTQCVWMFTSFRQTLTSVREKTYSFNALVQDRVNELKDWLDTSSATPQCSFVRWLIYFFYFGVFSCLRANTSLEGSKRTRLTFMSLSWRTLTWWYQFWIFLFNVFVDHSSPKKHTLFTANPLDQF